jgi:adenylate kinase
VGAKPRLAILGKQGAGKGTQGERLAAHLGVPRISTGDIFRAAVKAGTDAGQKAKSFMDAGELVPDDVVVDVVRERLEHDDVRAGGFVLDGFPRNVAQAEALERELGGIDLVVELDVPTEVVLQRLAGRRVCSECGTDYSAGHAPTDDPVCDRCGGKVVLREDDTERAIKRRLDLYEERTAPLESWYMNKDKLAAIDGTGDPDVVTARLLRAVERRLGGGS